MSDLSADSSVVAKWIVAEPDSPQALPVFRDTISTGGRPVLLGLAVVEVTNVIGKPFHRGLATEADVATMFVDLSALPCAIEPAAPRLGRALDIARSCRRSVHDALFVALIEDLGPEGVTSDEPLYRAVHSDFPNTHPLRDRKPGRGFMP